MAGANLNVIDNFMGTFISYIDSGFGLLRGDIGHLTSILIAIDVTIAALFWALDGEANVLGRLIKKVLYVGTFAFILNNFKTLADLIFQSFSRLGLDATANSMSASDLLKPGKLAGMGFDASHPLLVQVSNMSGLDSLMPNLPAILILLLTWLIVLLAFFVLAIQLFITVLEFKLTTLAGFVLVPFAFWNKTAFLAERVLGNVVTSGVKVMVLAVIVGIGSGYFGQFVTGLGGQDADIAQAASLILASLTFLGLGLFGPSIASGLVSGAPQLGAGAAVTTVGAAAAAGMLAGGTAMAGIRAVTGMGGSALGAVKAASSMISGGNGGGNGSGSSSPASPSSPPAGSVGSASAATSGTSASSPASSATSYSEGQPEWARKMQSEQRLRAHAQTAHAAISSGDRPMGSATPDISQQE